MIIHIYSRRELPVFLSPFFRWPFFLSSNISNALTVSIIISLDSSFTSLCRRVLAIFSAEFHKFQGFLQIFHDLNVSFPRFYVAKTRRDKFGRWKLGRDVRHAPERNFFRYCAKDAGKHNCRTHFSSFLGPSLILQHTIFLFIAS
jgi:hypothetical protein